MCKSTSTGTVEFLLKLFAKYGVLDAIVSDNGTQSTANEYKNFCKMYSIKHITTPTYHPRSNEQEERFMGIFQSALKKLRNELVDDTALTQFFLLIAYQNLTLFSEQTLVL